MNGNAIGTLTVYATANGVQTPLWQLSGQQTGQWNFGRISVQSPKSIFKVFDDEIYCRYNIFCLCRNFS